jgi:tetratricopeptide (TPR) repeat protein
MSPSPRKNRADGGGAPQKRGDGRPAAKNRADGGAAPQKRGDGRPAAKNRADGRPVAQKRGDGKAAADNRGSSARGSVHRRSPSTAGRWRRDQLPDAERTAVQAEYDGPPIPADITGRELDKAVANQLRSLPEKLAARVARHLVAAARLLPSDPDTAYRHTVAARARAARVPIVREASGETAYAAGLFKDALAELKAARRMNGSALYLPMIADCERALGRPERALALAKDPAVASLDEDGRIEMKIVESGARRDLGQAAAAVSTLEGLRLHTHSRAPWVARLRYAYAEALLADGRRDQALEWFQRAAGVDADGQTDAAARVAELEGLELLDTTDSADSHQ